MSRFSLKWKPQGAIPRDIGLTVKMQKLPEKRQECPAGCSSPPLMAVWDDYGQTFYTSNTGAVVLYSARIARADDPYGETWIDLNAVSWGLEVEQLGGSGFYVEVSPIPSSQPSSQLVLLASVDPAPCPAALVGRITVTPIYQGVALNVLTKDVAAIQMYCY